MSARARERGQHRLGVLVGEDRGDDHVVVAAGAAPAATRRRPGCGRRRRRRRRPRRSGRAGALRRRPSSARPRNASAAARPTSSATTTRPAPRARAREAHSGSPSTTVAPGATTASFSSAIASRVSPSTSVWSSATFVRTTTSAVEHVGRVQPAAEPGLDDRDLDACRRELGERRRRQHLELRRAGPLGGRPDALERLLEVGVLAVDLDPLAPAGDVRRGVRAHAQPFAQRGTRPPAGSRSTCRSCRRRGSRGRRAAARRARPAARASARGRTPPATGESDSSQSDAEGIELATVALELLALGLDHLAGRVGDEALVAPASPRRGRSRRAAGRLGLDVAAVGLGAVGPDDRVEDPLLLALELRPDARAPEDLGRRLDRLELGAGVRPRRAAPARARRSAGSRARAGSTRSPRSRAAAPDAAASAAARGSRARSPARPRRRRRAAA